MREDGFRVIRGETSIRYTSVVLEDATIMSVDKQRKLIKEELAGTAMANEYLHKYTKSLNRLYVAQQSIFIHVTL